MIERRSGWIVVIASIGGRGGFTNTANDTSSKWGVIGLTACHPAPDCLSGCSRSGAGI
jgi:hypothetical protein